MRNHIRAFSFLALAVLGCTTSQKSTGNRQNGGFHSSGHLSDELVIVTTSDFHSALDKAEGLAQVVRELRARHGQRMLFLDGGDLFQGSLEGNMSKGRSIVEFYNLLGLDAAAIGNHELDYGPNVPGRVNVNPGEDGLGNLRARAREARFKWLSANFVRVSKRGRPLLAPKVRPKGRHYNALGQETVFPANAIFERAGQKACVIGATTPSTASITNPNFIKGTRFEPLERIVKAEAEHLRKNEKCDYVLLTAHAGLLCNDKGRCLEEGDRAEILRLLKNLPRGTLDAVVAGHTHRKAMEVIHGTPVIEAEHSARVVGVLHLRKSDRTHRFEPFIPVPAHSEQPDVTALLKTYRDSARSMKSRLVGKSLAHFRRNYTGESSVGNLVADALRDAAQNAAGADFALVNAGGLRADFEAGPLTYGDVFNVLPFDNSLTIVDLKGSELRRVLEIALSGGHGIAGISGLRVKRMEVAPGEKGPWSRDLNHDGKMEDWERDLLVEVLDARGEPLRDDRMYKLATIDFLVQGGDHQSHVYDRIPASRKHIFPGVWVRDILVEHLKTHPEIHPSQYLNLAAPRVQFVPPVL